MSALTNLSTVTQCLFPTLDFYKTILVGFLVRKLELEVCRWLVNSQLAVQHCVNCLEIYFSLKLHCPKAKWMLTFAYKACRQTKYNN